jgi:tetratricopeptide (TPR) repeat protein
MAESKRELAGSGKERASEAIRAHSQRPPINTRNDASRYGWSASWRAVLAALAWALTFAACAADADVIAEGETLVRAGRYAEAYQLLEPLEDKLAGDIKFDYLLARSALQTGRPSKASFIYERILAANPNYLGVRLEMGQAYLALGDYARAKLEFETVLRFDNLPPGLREQAQIYSKAADESIAGRKTIGFGYVELGYGYDSNVQSATRTSEISVINGNTLILDPTRLKRGDHYKALALGGELIHALTERFSAFGGADARGRSYKNIDVADFDSLDGRFGFGYSDGTHSTRLGVNAGRYWLDYAKTRDTLGMTADYRYLVTKQDQFTFNAGASRFHFVSEDLKVNNFDLYQAAIGWLHAAADGRAAAGLTLIGGIENATKGRPDGDKPFYGARITLQTAFSDQIGAFFLGGVQRGKYSDVNALFNTKRRDDLYDVTAGLTWSFAKGWSLRPQVVYYKNKSNLTLFEYDRTDASVNLRTDF